MTSTWIFVKVAFIVLSIVAGLIFLYVISPAAKAVKKQQIEESLSFIINFVLFVWVGKIVLNINIFVTDPLAVLAYPSDSAAFYTAVLLLFANIAYKTGKKNKDVNTISGALVPVFLGSAFVYEFIEVVWNDNTLSYGHVGLLFVLLVIYVMRHEHVSAPVMTAAMFAVWSLGQVLLTSLYPYTTLYGYIMSPWFLVLVFITSLIALIYNKKKVK